MCLIIFFSSHIIFTSVATLFHLFSLCLLLLFFSISQKMKTKPNSLIIKITQDKMKHKQNKRQNSHKQQSKTWVNFVLANFLA